MLIHPTHYEHTSDYEKARTMAHEGIHWTFGPPPFQYNGKRYMKTDSIDYAERLVEEIVAECFLPEKEDEDDDPDPGGGDPLPPVCEEKLVAEYYTVYEREYRTGDACLSSDDVDGATWCSGVGTWVQVPKQKVRWVTQTVCSS